MHWHLAVDAEQIAVDEHGEAAAERLGDVAVLACGQVTARLAAPMIAAAVTFEDDRFGCML